MNQQMHNQQFITLLFITLPLHASMLLRHFQGARSQYLPRYISIYKEQYNKWFFNCAFFGSLYT